MNIPNPDSLLDLVAIIIAAAAFVGAAALPAWISHRHQNRKLSVIEKEVRNNHGPDGKNRNLRDDIDRIYTAVIDLNESVTETREEVAELRGELRGLTHRVDRIAS